MKKYILTLIAGVLIGATAFGGIAIATELIVIPSAHDIFVDGNPAKISAYNINGDNYIKARDFAAALDVGIWYNAETRSIMVETDRKYDPDYTGLADIGDNQYYEDPDFGSSVYPGSQDR